MIGNDAEALLHRKGGKGIVSRRIERIVVVEQLHDDAFATEPLDEPVELSTGGDRPGFYERIGHRPLATARQDEEVASCELTKAVEVIAGAPFLTPGEMTLADGTGESRVARRIAGDHDQVRAVRVGGPSPRGSRGDRGAKARAGSGEGELGTEDSRHACLFCRFGEAHYAMARRDRSMPER